jgi:hypothetical protein
VGRPEVGVGSGRLKLVPLDALDQCGDNGMSWNVVVAVLAEIRRFEYGCVFFFFGEDGGGGAGGDDVVGRPAVGVGSGRLKLVPLDALDQCGDNGMS